MHNFFLVYMFVSFFFDIYFLSLFFVLSFSHRFFLCLCFFFCFGYKTIQQNQKSKIKQRNKNSKWKTPHPKKKTRTNGAWQCGSGGVAVWQLGRGSVAARRGSGAPSLPRCHTPTATQPRSTATLRWFFGFGCCVVLGVDFLILNFCIQKFSELLCIQKKGKTTNKKQMRKR